MKNIVQNRKAVNRGDGELRSSNSRARRVMNLPRAIMEYLGRIAPSDEGAESDFRRTENYVRGRILNK